MNLHPETQGATRAPERIIGRPADSSGPGPEVMAASTLDGNRVYATDGVQVGHIKDIMLDVRGGRIAYVSLIRGVPALIQMLVAYYVLPALLDITLSPLQAGILALALNTAAYISEILRGALHSLGR
ncbi:ABC transporter permease subunit, partial [Burkholderia gladioli]|nr:ABC transporter permease subunit [Burkholderia gladioli]